MNIPFYKNYFTHKDIEYTSRVIKRGMYWANGPEIADFEKMVARLIGQPYALAFNSGTSALFAILDVLGIKGSEVIVPSFSFIATANAVVHVGGIPVFADIEENTFGLDPHDVEKKITKKTKAIIAVHFAGHPCQIEKLAQIAKKYGLLLIEDAAEAIGSKINNHLVGSFGIANMFSFTPTKVISTGEGGMVVTGSKKIYESLKLFRSHGRLETEDYFSSIKYMDYITLGYNFRMPTLIAAQGIAQMESLNDVIKMRKNLAVRYTRELNAIDELTTPALLPKVLDVFQMYTICVKEGRKKRDALQLYLNKQGIVSKVYFEPIHKTYFYRVKRKDRSKLPVTERESGKVLSLPLYPSMSTDEQDYVINKIKLFFKL